MLRIADVFVLIIGIAVGIPVAAQSSTPIPNGTWTMVQTNGFPVQTVGWEGLVYAGSPVKKAVMLGDYHELSSEPNEALISYDFDTNRWDLLNIGESIHSEDMPEGGHPVDALAWDPNRKVFDFYCCASGSNQPEMAYYQWWVDPIGQVGRALPTSPKPGFLKLESAVFDPANDVYVIYGGSSFVATWEYSPATNAYQKVTTIGSAPDPSVTLPGVAYDTQDHRSYWFGGKTGTTFFNDLHAYDAATNTWSALNPAGTAPSPRWGAAFAYDSTNNIFLLYGGQTSTTVYNDTWVYSPASNAWTQLAPATSPIVTPPGPRQTLAYDPDHNAFILVQPGKGGFTGGSGPIYSVQTWFFRYAGTGPNVGTLSASYNPPAGSINKNIDGWAIQPSLASSGSSLYAAWVESGHPFDTSNAGLWHIFASQYSGGVLSPLGGSPSSLDSEWSSYSESHSPSIALVGGAPWISWYKWNNSGQSWALWAKSWNGSSWIGGAVGKVSAVPLHAFQGRSHLIDIGGVPYIAFLEIDKNYAPERTFVYVKKWNGTAWVLVGSAPLNVNATANTTAGSVSIATDGVTPYVAWTEYKPLGGGTGQSNALVYAAKWDGAQWDMIANGINANAANWASDASIAFANGQPSIAWTERNSVASQQVIVGSYNGSSWQLSQSLNRTATGWAQHPSLVADGTSLYLAWVEQAALGRHSQAYVAQRANGKWTQLGTSLNTDPANGSAQRVSIAVVNGSPAAAWGEVNYGSTRQIFVKQWNGTAWDTSIAVSGSGGGATGGGGPTPASYNTAHPRIGYPSTGYLTSLYANMPPVFAKDANNYDPTCVAYACTAPAFRHLLLAYKASVAAGAPNASWLSKLLAVQSVGPVWGPLVYSDDNASAACSTGSTCTIADGNADFTTACSGGTCTGKYLTWQGFRYSIQRVTDPHHVMAQRVTSGQPFPLPNGSGLKIRLFNSIYQPGYSTFLYAMLYDWMYSEFTPQQQSESATELNNMGVQFQNDFKNNKYSPYNDEFYGGGPNSWIGAIGTFAAAVAAYPDGGSQALTNLNWANDLLFKTMLPVWKQILGDGGYHQSWNDYINGGGDTMSMRSFFVSAFMPYESAIGNVPGFWTNDNPWLKEFPYWLMYDLRPDWQPEHLEDIQPVLNGETQTYLSLSGAGLGCLNGLAEIYNDPTIRWFARLLNKEKVVNGAWQPNGYEPSAYPFYAPDIAANPVSAGPAADGRVSLPLVRNFTGVGVATLRTGWTENDSFLTFRYGDNYWSHEHGDIGSFTLYSQGALAIDSGTYHPGSYSPHVKQYSRQSIAHNVPLIKDPADYYPDQMIQVNPSTGAGGLVCVALPNDGGQRRIGSASQSYWGNTACSGGAHTNIGENSPDNLSAWQANSVYFHEGSLLAFTSNPNYVYMAADITGAYQNSLSGDPAAPGYGISNRSPRAQSVIRNMMWVPRGHSAYVVLYDQVVSGNPGFAKKWLLHSINQPTIKGNHFSLTRTENVVDKPYPGSWPGGPMFPLLAKANSLCGTTRGCYQYGGQLHGWVFDNLTPVTPQLIGGPGHEFDDGAGKNQNECQWSIACAAPNNPWGLGDTLLGDPAGFITSHSNTGPYEPGAWRIEVVPSAPNASDEFLTLLLATGANDTNVPSNPAPISASGQVGLTWSDNGCTYTAMFNQATAGATATASGVGCITSF